MSSAKHICSESRQPAVTKVQVQEGTTGQLQLGQKTDNLLVTPGFMGLLAIRAVGLHIRRMA